MTHHTRVIAKRMWDVDYGAPTDNENDPRNDGRDADEIYEDELAASRFAQEMRQARKEQEKR